MRERSALLVSNTTPLIALAAATGSLDVLKALYARVVVPLEVAAEIRAGGKHSFGVDVFEAAGWLDVQAQPRWCCSPICAIHSIWAKPLSFRPP